MIKQGKKEQASHFKTHANSKKSYFKSFKRNTTSKTATQFVKQLYFNIVASLLYSSVAYLWSAQAQYVSLLEDCLLNVTESQKVFCQMSSPRSHGAYATKSKLHKTKLRPSALSPVTKPHLAAAAGTKMVTKAMPHPASVPKHIQALHVEKAVFPLAKPCLIIDQPLPIEKGNAMLGHGTISVVVTVHNISSLLQNKWAFKRTVITLTMALRQAMVVLDKLLHFYNITNEAEIKKTIIIEAELNNQASVSSLVILSALQPKYQSTHKAHSFPLPFAWALIKVQKNHNGVAPLLTAPRASVLQPQPSCKGTLVSSNGTMLHVSKFLDSAMNQHEHKSLNLDADYHRGQPTAHHHCTLITKSTSCAPTSVQLSMSHLVTMDSDDHRDHGGQPQDPGNNGGQLPDPGDHSGHPGDPGEQPPDPGNPGGQLSDPGHPGGQLSDPGNPGGQLSDPGNPSGQLPDPGDHSGHPGDPGEQPPDPGNPGGQLSDPGNPGGQLPDPGDHSGHPGDPGEQPPDPGNPGGQLSDPGNPGGQLPDPGDHSGHPGDPGEQPPDPGNPGGQLSDPGNPGGQLSDPGNPCGQLPDPGDHSGHPGDPGEQPPDPGNPGGQLSDPGHPGGQLSDPGNPGGQLSDPGNPSGQLPDPGDHSGHPGDPGEQPPDPGNPGGQLSDPGNPGGQLPDPGDHSGHPGDPGEQPPDPGNPGGQLSDPGNPGGQLPDPGDHSGHPGDPGEQPPDPGNPGGQLSDPGNPGGQLSDPGNPCGQLPDPGDHSGHPGDPGEQPLDPGNPGGQPPNSGNLGGQSPDPGDPGGQPQDPGDNGGQLPDPGNPDGQPPDPGDPGGQPPDPDEHGGQPPDPGDNGGQPPDPGDNGGQPPDPGDNGGQPPDPGDNGGQPPDPGDNGGQPPDPGDHDDNEEYIAACMKAGNTPHDNHWVIQTSTKSDVQGTCSSIVIGTGISEAFTESHLQRQSEESCLYICDAYQVPCMNVDGNNITIFANQLSQHDTFAYSTCLPTDTDIEYLILPMQPEDNGYSMVVINN